MRYRGFSADSARWKEGSARTSTNERRKPRERNTWQYSPFSAVHDVHTPYERGSTRHARETPSRFKAIRPTHLATRTKRRESIQSPEDSSERGRASQPFGPFLPSSAASSCKLPGSHLRAVVSSLNDDDGDDDDDTLAFQLCNLTNSAYLYSM